MTYQTVYYDELVQEIQTVPSEYFPTLLQFVRLFRQSIMLKPAEESFKQGWVESMAGQTMPIDTLWDGIADE